MIQILAFSALIENFRSLALFRLKCVTLNGLHSPSRCRGHLKLLSSGQIGEVGKFGFHLLIWTCILSCLSSTASNPDDWCHEFNLRTFLRIVKIYILVTYLPSCVFGDFALQWNQIYSNLLYLGNRCQRNPQLVHPCERFSRNVAPRGSRTAGPNSLTQ